MKTFKNLMLFTVIALSFLFSACTDESELIVPEYETTEGVKAAGTDGEIADRD